MTEGNVVFESAGVSTEALATLGEGHIAYVKQIGSEDVPGLFPQAPKIAPGLKLFALHAADGTPIMLTDSREAAIANAWSNELQAVSVPCPGFAGVTDDGANLRYAGDVLGWSGTSPRILFRQFLSLSSRRQELHFPAMLLEAAFNDRRRQKICGFVDGR